MINAIFLQMRRAISIIILAAFISTSVKSPAYAQVAQDQMTRLPAPGTMVHLSPEFMPAQLTGITIHHDNALRFDFLIHKGDQNLEGDQKKKEYKKLVKYFMASLTTPDDDQWVNLSPYEKNRIIKEDFGKTEMGRDLLAQDYLLKQITSSLIYPEEGLGKEFWDKIYQRAWNEYHTTNIPVNTFNKVWIVPQQAIVYESGNTAYILKSTLKVMLEEDYLSLSKHTGIASTPNTSVNKIGSQVIREVVLPALEKEVNEGKNFASLRQVYSGMILATWYKKALKESLLGQIYADKAKVKGVDQNPRNNEIIYRQYLKAFKKGVFNYIKEDVDKFTNETVPRKYFSGGFFNNLRPGTRDGAMTIVDGKGLVSLRDHFGEQFWQDLTTHLQEQGMPDDRIVVDAQPFQIGGIGMGGARIDIYSGARGISSQSKIKIDAAMGVVSLESTFSHIEMYLKFGGMEDQIQSTLEEVTKELKENFAGFPAAQTALTLLEGASPENIEPKIPQIENALLELVEQEHQSILEGIKRAGERQRKIAQLQSALSVNWVTLSSAKLGNESAIDQMNGVISSVQAQLRQDFGGYRATQPLLDALESQKGKFDFKNTTPLFDELSKQLDAAMLETQPPEMINSRMEQYKPTENPYVKKPIMGYPITSDKFEDIPIEIRKYLGMEDNKGKQVEYETKYLRDNVGGFILIQMKDGKPDFFVPPKNTLTNYKQIGLAEVNAGNSELFGQLTQLKVMQLPGLVGMKTTEVVDMVKMSDIGYNIADEVSISTPSWGNQTKPAGSDAYLRWSSALGQYTMVNSEKGGNPSNWIPADAAMMTFKKISAIFALALACGAGGCVSNPANHQTHIPDLKEAKQISMARDSQEILNPSSYSNKYRDLQLQAQSNNYWNLKELLMDGSPEHIITVLLNPNPGHPWTAKEIALLKEVRDFYLNSPLSDAAPVPILSPNQWDRFKWNQREGDIFKKTLLDALNIVILHYEETMPNNSSKTKEVEPGGIDLNSANLNLQIKRDSRGVPLPLAQQDMAQLSRIQGFDPVILEISPAVNIPIISEIQQKLQSSAV